MDLCSTVIIVDADPGTSSVLFHAIKDGGHFDPVVVNASDLVPLTVATRPRAFVALTGNTDFIGLETMINMRAMGFDIPWILVGVATANGSAAMRLGAAGFVDFGDLKGEIVDAISSAVSGKSYLSRSALNRVQETHRYYETL